MCLFLMQQTMLGSVDSKLIPTQTSQRVCPSIPWAPQLMMQQIAAQSAQPNLTASLGRLQMVGMWGSRTVGHSRQWMVQRHRSVPLFQVEHDHRHRSSHPMSPFMHFFLCVWSFLYYIICCHTTPTRFVTGHKPSFRAYSLFGRTKPDTTPLPG